MSFATLRMAAMIFMLGQVEAHVDSAGNYHPQLVGMAARQIAWQWTSATAILWVAALASWLFWERGEALKSID